jgi:O-antigen/teichoic acid export membrane protein/GT2 family glycosyltransferase
MTSAAHPAPAAGLWGGAARVLLAEALVLPTGLAVAAFLTRRLGPEGYGLLAVAATVLAWLQWSLTSLFARTVVKFVSEAEDWRPVARAAVRLHLAGGLLLAAALWAGAPALAALFGEPALSLYLRLFALDLPLFGLAHAYRHVLVGRGAFGPRAWATAARWVTRLLVVIVLVELGLSVPGAILGSLAGSLAELALAWRGLRRLEAGARGPAQPFPLRRLWGYALPLALMALSLRLFDKLDLFALKALGAPAATAGHYSAAQNLAWLPGLFALSFSPLLLSSLTRQLAQGESAAARGLARQSLRAVLLLLPMAALAAGAAPELIALAFGPAFAPAAPLLPPLLLGALALVLLSATTAMLTALGQPALTLALTAPLLPLAALGHWLVIPRAGPLGAALVTAGLSGASALLSLVAVQRLWGVRLPRPTAARSLLVAALAFGLGAAWPASGAWLLLKLALGLVLIAAALAALGEAGGWNQDEAPHAEERRPTSELRDTSNLTRDTRPLTPESNLAPHTTHHEHPRFSVVVPTYGRPAALEGCLQGLRAQAYPPEQYEVIVVDDGSAPADHAAATALCARYGARLLAQPHAGPGRARNHGAAQARGGWLAFTDDDCRPEPGWLEALHAALARHPGAAVGGPVVNALPRNPYAAASQALIGFLHGYYNRDADDAGFLTSNNLALPAADFHALGGFDAALPLAAAEDRELCERWRGLGRRLVYAPRAVVAHAHTLTVRAFWQQHFRYGRGAHACRLARRQRGQPPAPVEPPRFYLGLARAVTRAMPPGWRALGPVLALASQAAHTLGFLYQQRRHGVERSRARAALQAPG